MKFRESYNNADDREIAFLSNKDGYVLARCEWTEAFGRSGLYVYLTDSGKDALNVSRVLDFDDKYSMPMPGDLSVAADAWEKIKEALKDVAE